MLQALKALRLLLQMLYQLRRRTASMQMLQCQDSDIFRQTAHQRHLTIQQRLMQEKQALQIVFQITFQPSPCLTQTEHLPLPFLIIATKRQPPLPIAQPLRQIRESLLRLRKLSSQTSQGAERPMTSRQSGCGPQQIRLFLKSISLCLFPHPGQRRQRVNQHHTCSTEFLPVLIGIEIRDQLVLKTIRLISKKLCRLLPLFTGGGITGKEQVIQRHGQGWRNRQSKLGQSPRRHPTATLQSSRHTLRQQMQRQRNPAGGLHPLPCETRRRRRLQKRLDLPITHRALRRADVTQQHPQRHLPGTDLMILRSIRNHNELLTQHLTQPDHQPLLETLSRNEPAILKNTANRNPTARFPRRIKLQPKVSQHQELPSWIISKHHCQQPQRQILPCLLRHLTLHFSL